MPAASSPPDWSLVDVEARRALLTHLGRSPLAEVASVDAPVQWVLTGAFSNTHNGVLATRTTPGGASRLGAAEPPFGEASTDADLIAAITATLERFAAARVPGIWYLDADSPAELASLLI